MGELVLARRIGETIVINGNIRVTIRNISGHQVKVGVNAPREMPVHRQEIQERIDAEYNAALTGVADSTKQTDRQE